MKKPKLRHISDGSVDLPDVLVYSILFEFLSPGWNVGLTCKKYCNVLQKEQTVLRGEVVDLMKAVQKTIEQKTRIRPARDQAVSLLTAMHLAADIKPRVYRLESLSPSSSWIPLKML